NLEIWKISFINTGFETKTGGRIKKIEKYIKGDNFCLTYGDGVSNVNIKNLIRFHEQKKKIGTLTAVHPMSPFGIIEKKDGLIKSFKQKPRLDGIINGGFFVFNRKIFNYLDEDSVLEEEPLRTLSEKNQLAVYEHSDFWACMDTFKDVERLNNVWSSGKVPWKTWND
ncbi:sugar phosphate nucleotidyltransferase, partial [Acidobacteriota bacterium]